MAAKKPQTATAIDVETVAPVHNPRNVIDWNVLVTGIGADAIAADTDTVRAAQAQFAEIGKGQLTDEKASTTRWAPTTT